MAKVVLIDDEERLRATLVRFLERAGHEVVSGGGFDAVEAHLYPGGFDVLVTDIVMPGSDGHQILEEVVRRGCQEPVILVTGEPNLESASRAVRSGAFDYVQKPVTKDRLVEVVERGVRTVRLLRERDEARERELAVLRNLAEIGESASVLTHEIRTPLHGLRHALMAVGDKLGLEDSSVIEDFVRSLARIERLLGETLSFARPLRPELEPVDLRDVVEQAVGECRTLDVFEKMVVDDRIEAGSIVRLDANLLGDVFSNLCRNAAEACDGAGRIAISGTIVGDSLRIDVQDDGPGVPPAQRGEIFKPFHSYKYGGNGIGLAFSRKIVEAHGGRLDLVSSAEGACFRVELPRRVLVEASSADAVPSE